MAIAAAALAAAALGWSAPNAGATFPGDNGLIVWSRVFGHQDAEIWSLDLDTGVRAQLTNNDRTDFEPAWSPDGRYIAFASSTADDVDVYVAKADGSGEHNLSNHPGTADRWPAWSPAGDRIVFSRQNFDGTSSIWVMHTDGSHQTELVPDTFANERPVWSPDGSEIVFASNRTGNFDLYTMTASGAQQRPLTATPEIQEENPNWSPDGTMIAYDACISPTYPCAGFAPNYEIFTLTPSDGTVDRLTTVDGIDTHPAWSPDGSQIVFRSDRTHFTALWLMDADGSGQRILTNRQFLGGVDPDWQPV